MKCSSCKFDNDDINKFCIKCGRELNVKSASTVLKCPGCGADIKIESKYCIHCGTKLKDDAVNKSAQGINSSVPKKKKKQTLAVPNKKYDVSGNGKYRNSSKILKVGSPNLKPLWIIVGITIGSILIAISFELIFHKYPGSKELQTEKKSSNPVIEVQVSAIASKFACSCQTNDCNHTSLDSCTCSKAAEERQFIRENLEKDNKSNDIVIALANEYGFLKSEFASQYKVDPNRIWKSNQIRLDNN